MPIYLTLSEKKWTGVASSGITSVTNQSCCIFYHFLLLLLFLLLLFLLILFLLLLLVSSAPFSIHLSFSKNLPHECQEVWGSRSSFVCSFLLLSLFLLLPLSPFQAFVASVTPPQFTASGQSVVCLFSGLIGCQLVSILCTWLYYLVCLSVGCVCLLVCRSVTLFFSAYTGGCVLSYVHWGRFNLAV